MKKGFTLIELLIVVAIIAILAAIAVPNFLEAQTRSKVARVYADMRSMATAIEEYSTDYNRPPIGGAEGRILFGLPNELCYPLPTYSRMTTPIAYITSVPKDPFAMKGLIGMPTRNVKEFWYQVYVKGYSVNTTWGAVNDRGYMWHMHSVGPSRDDKRPDNPTKGVQAQSILCGKQPLWVYDSTNGTVSFGYIIRTSKGIYGGDEYKEETP